MGDRLRARIAEKTTAAATDTASSTNSRPVKPGMVEVWSRVTLADGLEVQLEPGRAGMTPEQVRAFIQEVKLAYRRVREPGSGSH